MAAQKRLIQAAGELDLKKKVLLSLFVVGNLVFTYFFLRGAYVGYISYRLQTSGQVIVGTVTGQRAIKDTKPNLVRYLPVIQYQVDGQTYTHISGIPSGVPEYETDSHVTLIYDPAHPATSRINTWEGLWLDPGFALLFIPIASILGNFLFLRAWLKPVRSKISRRLNQ